MKNIYDFYADQFSAIFETYRENFSGVCLVKNENEVLLSGAAGLANRDFNVPNTMTTRFDTASVTKIFTAAAVLHLAQSGKLRLDDKIHSVLGRELEGTQIHENVLIENLLNHTSGIADDADEEAGEDYSALFAEKPNYAIRNCADFLPNFVRKPANFPPGTNVRYNNCAYVLLGLVIEKITGTDYRTYTARNIFEPAGMFNTYFGAKDEICPNTAEGYFALKNEDGGFIKWKKNIYSYPPIGTPDGGAFTTAGDLDIFIRGLKNGKILSREYTDLIMKPHCDFTRQTKYGTWRTGYGFEFFEIPDRGFGKNIFCMYKEGGNPGVDAICSYFPAVDISINILSNQDGPFWKMYGDFRDVLFKDTAR